MQVYHMCLKLFTSLWQAGWIKKHCCFCNKKNMFLPNGNLPYEVDFDGTKTDILKTYQAVPMEMRADQSHQADDSLWVLNKSCPIQRTIFGWFEVHWWLRKYHESHHISIRLKSYRLHLSESTWTPLQRCRCGECVHLGLSRGYTPTYGSLNEENYDKTWW